MNKLQEIMEWYKLTIESQRVTLKILNFAPEVVPLDSSLAEYTLSQAKRILLKAENELNDLTVLSLVSVFEQSLLDHLKDLSKEAIEKEEKTLSKSVLKYALKNSDRWHFRDVLDIFKSVLNTELVGSVKQVYDYRNWVAHGKKETTSITKIDPELAYNRLNEFLGRLGK
ncbi:hypothetical protein D9O40_02465 [Clostridium autoethanogenum]|uniref:RiboL-PSP-HEPN domain-containing protein n=1 Tax=Clostridium autoethanogenum TaxID=84023 RepID=A0A3M0T125_9CLOT|nr:hypothetical protein [Clostridium autoethanogenum]RMD04330.1 hypothetical protein D9O40_02465 [Clostridium autoethanogenum]